MDRSLRRGCMPTGRAWQRGVAHEARASTTSIVDAVKVTADGCRATPQSRTGDLEDRRQSTRKCLVVISDGAHPRRRNEVALELQRSAEIGAAHENAGLVVPCELPSGDTRSRGLLLVIGCKRRFTYRITVEEGDSHQR